MTREELIARYEAELLLFVVEAWAVRHEDRSRLASAIDRQHVRVKALLGEIYDALCPRKAIAPTNGEAPRRLPATNGRHP